MQAALPSTPASGSYGLNVCKKKKKKFHSSLVDSLDVRDSLYHLLSAKWRVCPTLVLGMWPEVRPGTDG